MQSKKWRVFRSRWSGYWYAVPPRYGVTPYSEDALPVGFATQRAAFDFAFWEATRERSLHEVP